MAELKIDLLTYPHTQLVGLSVRTCNQDEMAASTRKIPGLWESFYRDLKPHVTADAPMYGVYTNYESDHNGRYDIHASVASSHFGTPPQNCVPSEIRAGQYLRFTPQSIGEDPVKQVIEMWQRVWAHFSDQNCEQQRAFSTDFELYHPDKPIELFIAVKS